MDGAAVAAGIGVEIHAAQARIAADAIGIVGQFKARRQRLDLVEGADVEVADRLLGDRVDHRGHVLNVFAATTRLDDDDLGVETGVAGCSLFLGRLGKSRRRDGECRDTRADQIIGRHAIHK